MVAAAQHSRQRYSFQAGITPLPACGSLPSCTAQYICWIGGVAAHKVCTVIVGLLLFATFHYIFRYSEEQIASSKSTGFLSFLFFSWGNVCLLNLTKKLCQNIEICVIAFCEEEHARYLPSHLTWIVICLEVHVTGCSHDVLAHIQGTGSL